MAQEVRAVVALSFVWERFVSERVGLDDVEDACSRTDEGEVLRSGVVR